MVDPNVKTKCIFIQQIDPHMYASSHIRTADFLSNYYSKTDDRRSSTFDTKAPESAKIRRHFHT